MKRSLRPATIVLGLTLATSSSVAQEYEMRVMGTLGEEHSSGGKINDSGVATGVAWSNPHPLPPLYRTFIFRRDIVPLPALPGFASASAREINNHGVAVGNCVQGYEGDPVAVMWNAQGNVSPIEFPFEFHYGVGSASGINDVGQIIANAHRPLSNARVAILIEGNSFRYLFHPRVPSEANDINAKGQIVGTFGSTTATSGLGYVWDKGSVSFLPGLTGYSKAAAISNNGTIVGHSGIKGHSWEPRAYLWRNGIPVELPSELAHSYAFAVNDLAQVLGVEFNYQGKRYYVLWQNGKKIRMDDMLPPSSGFVRLEGYSINNHGQICGAAFTKTNHSRGVILTPK